MRVAQFSEFGGPQALRLEEVAEPRPGPGDVLIKVTAVGLNFFDTLLLRNQYQVTPPLPFSPGAEIAGSIEAVGAEVADLKLGQRVVAFIGGNGCREKVVTKARNVVPIPDGVSDDVAAGIPITYGTALHGLKDRGALSRVRPWRSSARREERVSPPSRSPSSWVDGSSPSPRRPTSSPLPASMAPRKASITQTEDLKARLKQLTAPKGVDVLYDPVGGAYAEPSLRAMAWEGRYLVLGFASGTIPKIPLNLVMLKGCAIMGVFWTAFVERYPEKHRANMIELLDWCRRGLITPHIHASFALIETATGPVADRGPQGYRQGDRQSTALAGFGQFLVERACRRRPVGRRDMRGDETDHRREQRRIVGEAEPRDHVGDDVDGQDEIGDGRKQHAAHAHRGRRVERAVIGGDQVVDEGNHPGEPLELGPEVAPDLALPLGEGRKRKLPAEGRSLELACFVEGHHRPAPRKGV